MSVLFKCKSCGQEHACPLYFQDEETFRSAHFGLISIPCPCTQRAALYQKRDMSWVREEPRKALRYASCRVSGVR